MDECVIQSVRLKVHRIGNSKILALKKIGFIFVTTVETIFFKTIQYNAVYIITRHICYRGAFSKCDKYSLLSCFQEFHNKYVDVNKTFKCHGNRLRGMERSTVPKWKPDQTPSKLTDTIVNIRQ